MADSELERSEIDEIILVGGSTMIPKIQRLVKDYFYGKEPNIGSNQMKRLLLEQRLKSIP
jgi:heat shock protein 5